MKTFGNKNEFAMSIYFYTDKYKDSEDIEDFFCGAEVYFWVKGKNLFAFKHPAPGLTYSYCNLYTLVDFLSKHLVDHLTQTAFPMETQADNAADMIQETRLIKGETGDRLESYMDFDWDSVDMDLRKKRDDWITNHGFLKNSGAISFPNIIIRKVCDKIEVSWHNKNTPSCREYEFSMLHTKGVEYIDPSLYREVVTQFCFAYIEHIKEREPRLSEKYRINLRKAMRVPI